MTKFLSRKSRLWLSVIINFSCILVLAGMVLQNLREPSGDWVRGLGIWLQLGAAFLLLAVMLILTNSQPTVMDFVEEAREQLGTEERMLKAWSSVREQRVTFPEMNRKEKLRYLAAIAGGVAFWLYAIAEMLHLIPGEPRLSFSPGEVTPIPRWLLAFMTFAIGYVCFIVAWMERSKLVDEWDEDLKKFLRDVGA